MLCSNCSHPIKPVVAVDIDGTLGDYHGHFLRFAAEWIGEGHGFDPGIYNYDGQMAFSTWCEVTFGIDLATYRQIKLAYRQGGMKRTMRIWDGSYALCGAIRDAGAELWMTTTRPYLSLDNIVPDTVEWCRRHQIDYDGMLFDELKYEEFSKRIDPSRVVAVFDDLSEMYDAANDHFPGRAWLVRGRYNYGVRRTQMCDLDSAADIAVAAIHDWRVRYDDRVTY